ncbi:hypothetical protein [Parabacteroides sp. FAFU027]|uniref:hypothetical protein n=1 Tax=Parabacteroides sp. FAFU027 TaxID=2922715 RepID=UPI001FAEFE23|nr:hypothetical protein [Parabacteroides sp. FAFU027]
MKKLTLICIVLLIPVFNALAQSDTTNTSSKKHCPHSYDTKQALEFESLAPMFLTGGFHLAACYRYEKFRVRVSVINGGNYDAEPAGIKNSSANFKRYYKTSPGLFLGYNIWKNLEAYTYLESHTFGIEQKSTGIEKDIHSTDFGGGISYQFFIGRNFYVQPGYHIYLRSDKSANFGSTQYHIPNVDLAPVLRIGCRIWSKY